MISKTEETSRVKRSAEGTVVEREVAAPERRCSLQDTSQDKQHLNCNE